MHLSTSNHEKMEKFIESYTSSYDARLQYIENGPVVAPDKPIYTENPCYHKSTCVILNTEKNDKGFSDRKKRGRIAGTILADRIAYTPFPIDIVCHSFGFAYAQGIIEELEREGIKLGRYYILAPENAGSGSVDVTESEEVYQYGSDEEELKEKPWLQDGVAPQTAVIGLQRDSKKSGRAYIPDTEPQGFVESHVIKNYLWIFEIPELEKGYVKPR